MTLITVAWIAFGLGTTLGFFLARSVENEEESLEHAQHDAGHAEGAAFVSRPAARVIM